MVCRRVEVFELDTENLKVSARGYGERPGTDGTWVRAIGEERWCWKVVDRYLDSRHTMFGGMKNDEEHP